MHRFLSKNAQQLARFILELGSVHKVNQIVAKVISESSTRIAEFFYKELILYDHQHARPVH